MQIRFTPHKLRASKAYISNLMADNIIKNRVIKKEKSREEEEYIEDKRSSISIFKRFLNLFR